MRIRVRGILVPIPCVLAIAVTFHQFLAFELAELAPVTSNYVNNSVSVQPMQLK